MYNYIFHSKAITVLFVILLTLLASLLTGSLRFWWRSLLFNITPAIASSFFVVALLSTTNSSTIDILSCLFFEFSILCLYCKLLYITYNALYRVPEHTADNLLGIALALQVFFFLQIVGSEGYGLFTDGSRIEYLSAGSGAKYYTYAASLLAKLQIGLLAHRLSRGKVGVLVVIVILFQFIASLLSGSKGSFFLWLFSVMALIDYSRARFSKKTIFTTISALSISIAIVATTISQFLGITIDEFFNLAFNRIFLFNDARALAFDLRSNSNAEKSFIDESFRSLTIIMNSHPKNPPIGIYLYDNYFGYSGGNGANGSLSALMVLYSTENYTLIYAILAIIISTIFFITIIIFKRSMRRNEYAYTVSLLGTVSLAALSQDFLAFQLVIILSGIGLFAMWTHDRWNFSYEKNV